MKQILSDKIDRYVRFPFDLMIFGSAILLVSLSTVAYDAWKRVSK